MKDLIDIERRSVEDVVGALLSEAEGQSVSAGQKLVSKAREHGIGIKDYLRLSVDPRQGDFSARLGNADVSGYEVAKAFLNLPVRSDFDHGVTLEASSQTFQRYPGTRALFPEVIDDMLTWKDRQDQIERLEPLIAQSRTITGTELLSTVIDDDSAERGTFTVPELANIPVRTIRSSEQSVKMFKHGSGYRTSYEFNRRASLDMLTPFAARITREKEISKVAAATNILINGDGVNGAATAQDITAFGGDVSGGKTLKNNYQALAKWLMKMAMDGVPADTVVGNYDMFIELLFMFLPTAQATSEAEALQVRGAPSVNLGLPILNNNVNFVLSSTMPAGKLLAYNRSETIEELVEAGSLISESEASIRNQAIVYFNTETSGMRIVWGDTRRILDTTQ